MSLTYDTSILWDGDIIWGGIPPLPPTLAPLARPTTRHWLKVAFDSHATDGTYIWTDITDFLREDRGTPLSTRRGRQDTTQKFNVGQGIYVLDNRHQHFESLNPSGMFYGKLVPTKPVQSGDEYPWLPGQMIDGAFRNPSSYQLWTALNGTLSYLTPAHDLAQGGVRLNVAASGSNINLTSPAIPVRSDKLSTPVTASLRVSNANGITNPSVALSIIFYSDLAGTAAISNVTGPAVNVNFTTLKQRLTVTASAIPTNALSMRVQFATLTSTSIAIHHIWDFYSSVLDYTAISFSQENYTGFADSWVCTDDVGDGTCVLTASDTLKNLSLTPMNSPFYAKYLATLNPTVWYRLGESGPQANVRTMPFKDAMGGPPIYCNNGNSLPVHLSAWGFPYDTSYYFFNNGPLPGVAGHSPVDPDLAFSFIGPSSQDRGSLVLGNNCKPTGTKWSYAFSFRSTTGQWHNNADLVATGGLYSFWTLFGINAAQLGTFPNQPHPSPGHAFLSVAVAPNAIDPVTGSGLGVDTAGGQLTVYAGIDGVAGAGQTTHQNIVIDKLSHRVWLTYDGSTDLLSIYIDGLLDVSFHPTGGMGINWTSTSAFNQLGDVDMIGKDGDPGGFEMDEFMFFNGTTMGASTIATDYDKFRRAYPIQRSTERVAAVYDLINLPTNLRSVNTAAGVQVTAVESPFFQANPLTYLQLVEDTEQGLLFCDRSGRVNFVDHAAAISGVYTTSQYTFGNGVGELSYEKVVTSNDDTLLYTQGIASIAGGSPQTVNSSNAADYFVRSLQKTNLLLDTDAKAKAIATSLATLYSVPGTKIKELHVYPEADEATLLACSRIEIGWLLAVKLRPNGISLPPVNVQVQGINQDTYRGKRRIVYFLSNIYWRT